MKRVLLAVAILMGSASVVVPTLTITASAQTCDPNSPCLYSGTAKVGGGSSTVTIVVKMDKRGNPVAEVNGKGTYYVFLSQTDEEMSYGNYYINIDGDKYYFTM